MLGNVTNEPSGAWLVTRGWAWTAVMALEKLVYCACEWLFGGDRVVEGN